MKRRGGGGGGGRNRLDPSIDVDEDDDDLPDDPGAAPPIAAGGIAALQSSAFIPSKNQSGVMRATFLAVVAIPTILVALYYLVFASDQYMTQSLFAVRGTSSTSMDTFGFTSLVGGSTVQSSDSYIVVDYITSAAILKDIQTESGLDVRKVFASPNADWWVRADPDAPLNVFLDYWLDRISVGYNSTTGVITFETWAFTARESEAVARAVLRASENLVNDLSVKARQQLVEAARGEVQRTEERLRAARRDVQVFREREQTIDPSKIAEGQLTLISQLEAQLVDLKARRDTLLQTIDVNSPSVRVLDRQINALDTQIVAQRARLGSGEAKAAPADEETKRTLSRILGDYLELSLEESFAQQAYTSALASLETAIAEARKQERYFATFVEPTAPEVALYPRRLANTLLFAFAATVLWGLIVLFIMIVRDHAL